MGSKPVFRLRYVDADGDLEITAPVTVQLLEEDSKEPEPANGETGGAGKNGKVPVKKPRNGFHKEKPAENGHAPRTNGFHHPKAAAGDSAAGIHTMIEANGGAAPAARPGAGSAVGGTGESPGAAPEAERSSTAHQLSNGTASAKRVSGKESKRAPRCDFCVPLPPRSYLA